LLGRTFEKSLTSFSIRSGDTAPSDIPGFFGWIAYRNRDRLVARRTRATSCAPSRV